MMVLPELALSVRQPWAWAIIYGGKPIENRSWQAVNHGLRQRGRVCIHAAKGLTQDEYRFAATFMSKLGLHSVTPPAPHLLARGCIIGTKAVTTEVDKLADMFERPAKLAAITGTTVDVKLTADAAKSVASVLRLLGGRSPTLTRAQAEQVIRLLLDHTSLSTIIKLWLSARFVRWAKS